MLTATVEKPLVVIVVLLWLWPFLKSLRTGKVHVLHPQCLTPIWISYFVLNTMIQVWLSWMGGTEYGILRTTDAEMAHNRTYLIIPLVFVGLCAPFYHFGVRIFNPSIAKSGNDLLCIKQSVRVVRKSRTIMFSTLGLLASATCWLPNYFIPNEGFGTFWTYPLAMVNVILPLMLFNIHKVLGVVSLALSFVGAAILHSKASFVYPLLPFIMYYVFLYFRIRSFKAWMAMFVGFGIIVLSFSIGGFGNDARRLLHRDYAFESFAALVNKSENRYFGNAEYIFSGTTNGPITSWTFSEFEKGVPSILHPGKRNSINPSKAVTSMYLPEDYKALPNAYFNRFLVFSGYYDLGLIGAFLNALFVGMFYSFIWKVVKKKVMKTNLLWPIFLYMPIPAIGTYFIAVGGVTYGLINAFVPIAIVYILIFISKLKLSPYRSEKIVRNGS
jgi:hypothetical protein